MEGGGEEEAEVRLWYCIKFAFIGSTVHGEWKEGRGSSGYWQEGGKAGSERDGKWSLNKEVT